MYQQNNTANSNLTTMALQDNKYSSPSTFPSSPPSLITEKGDREKEFINDFNKENNVNYSSSPSSVLGFSNNLTARIQKSKSLLDSYVKEQREKADELVRKQADVYELERKEISAKIQELKDVQCKRGVIKDDNADGSDTNFSATANGGLVSEQDEIDRKLVEVEKELMKCQLEHKKVDKNLRGEFYRNVNLPLFPVQSKHRYVFTHLRFPLIYVYDICIYKFP